MRRYLSVSAIAALAAVGVVPASAAAGGTATQSYIVVLSGQPAGVRSIATELAASHGGRVGFVYEHSISGFSVTVSSRAAAAMARDPRVSYVELDRPVSTDEVVSPTGIKRASASTNTAIDIDGVDDKRVDVDVAVIDTGIDRQQPDLNVVGGTNCASGGPFGYGCSGDGDDDHYHGTHVAGTIGALDNGGNGIVGVAPGARLWAVKVLNSNGSGYTSWIVAGIDWVAARANDIEVANMSLGGSGFSQAEFDAIQRAVDKGVAFAVAAGNSAANAANYSPAAFSNVLTVSALADFDGAPGGSGSPTCRSDVDDTNADFSNYGSVVDIAAPGVCILSTYPLEKGGVGTISGTSMASPHAAGGLALLASVNNPNSAANVAALYSSLISKGGTDWTDESGDGSKERLLNVGSITPTLIDTGGGGSVNAAPVASFTKSCSSLTCTFTSTSTDSDGSVVAWSWSASNGSTGSNSTFTVTFAAAGTYTVTLTVTDDKGAVSAPSSQQVKVGTTTKRK